MSGTVHLKQCCCFGMFIPDLDFSILDPGSGFFHPRVADPDPKHWMDKKIQFFTPKIVSKLSDIWSEMFMPESRIRIPGSKSTGSRIRNTDIKGQFIYINACWRAVIACKENALLQELKTKKREISLAWNQSMGARNRVGIGLSYRPARLYCPAALHLGIDSRAP